MTFARSLLCNPQAVTIEEAGHVPQYEQPEQVHAALLPFLAVPPPAPAGAVPGAAR